MKVYEKKSFPRTARDLKVMYEKGKLSFDNAVQRSFVWKNNEKDNRMSMLIDTMMRGLPIPSMYCNCLFEDVKNKLYDFIDGKQRTLTMIKFLNNEFKLVNIPVFEDEDGNVRDFNGLTYSELPEDMQDSFRTYSLTVYYYDNMEQEDAEEMFRRLNNGKSLTALELLRANAVSKKEIAKLGKHEIFKKTLSEKALSGLTNENIVIKTWVLLFSDKKSFEIKNTRLILRNEKFTEEQTETISKIFDTYLEIFDLLKDKNKIFKKVFLDKTQMISLATIVKKVNDENIELNNFIDWIINFFETNSKEISIDENYNKNSKGRTAVTEKAVMERMKILEDSFTQFIEE